MRDVLVLGSTGSIGVSALEVLGDLDSRHRVVGLAAFGGKPGLLAHQARDRRVPLVAVAREESAGELRRELAGTGTEILAGPDAAVEMIRRSGAEVVIHAVAGIAGLPAAIEAVRTGARLALANKEACVAAGHLLMRLAREHGTEILPVDSEHSAVFQALRAGRPDEVKRVVLTASGGPFRDWPADRIERATVDEALRHPTWTMGRKITIDSATLVNKALEVVEARWLFDLDPDRIEVLVHPQSVVHALVEFVDGSVVAQMGPPDMKTPIRYALTHPERAPSPAPGLDLAALGSLTFEEPDADRFPAVRLGHVAARAGGTAGAVLNAANEAAVELFLAGRLPFPEIGRRVEDVLARHDSSGPEPELDEIMRADRWAREEIAACPTS